MSHRLYRQHTDAHESVWIKDLNKLGRDLAKTIIVDNTANNFQWQPNNGILIKSWVGDPNDSALDDLRPVLLSLVQKRPPDVRVALQELRE